MLPGSYDYEEKLTKRGWINTDVRYPIIYLISEIYKGRSFSFYDTDSSK